MIEKLKNLAGEYGCTQDGNWLLDFDWCNVPVTFRKLPAGIIGMQRFGKIVLAECPEPELIFDIYIHELRHVWQRKKHPVHYVAGKLFRPLIERDADREEAKAGIWLEGRGK